MKIDLTKADIKLVFGTIKKRKEDIDLTMFEYKHKYRDNVPYHIQCETSVMRIEYAELEKLKMKIKNNHPEVLI